MQVPPEADQRIRREARLRKQVLAGDASAWELLYRGACGPLFAYVALRGSQRQGEIEEIVQECWLTAVRRIRVFDPRRGSFESWIQGIARHTLLNRWRAAERERTRNHPLPDEEPPTERSPESLRERVALALSALPARYQDLIRARYLHEWSVKEIAGRLQQTPKAVESQLTRARAAFRKHYGRT